MYGGASDPHLDQGLRDPWHCLLHHEDQQHQGRGRSSFLCQIVCCLGPLKRSFSNLVTYSSAQFSKVQFTSLHFNSLQFNSIHFYLTHTVTHCVWVVNGGEGVTEMHICSWWNKQLLIAICWRHASVRPSSLTAHVGLVVLRTAAAAE